MAKSKFMLTDRDVQLATAGISAENVARELAKFARSELANAIANGEASTIYQTFVNGVEGDGTEDRVVAPGPILYRFSYWLPIIEFARKKLHERSPVLSGRYRDSHVVMIGSQIITPDAPIAANEEIMIVNTQPYSRVLEVGNVRVRPPASAGIYRIVQREVQSQFRGALRVQFRLILLPNGYILKGRFRRGVKPGARRKLATDTQAGARLSYPALVIRMV